MQILLDMKKRKLNKETRRWIRFLKKDCNDQDWDYETLLKMEREKLTQMANWFDSYYLDREEKKIVNVMRLAVRLLDIVIESPDRGDTYVNIKNIHRFFSPPMVQYLLEDMHRHTLCDMDVSFISLREYALESIRCQKAWYLYNKLRFLQLRNWWD